MTIMHAQSGLEAIYDQTTVIDRLTLSPTALAIFGLNSSKPLIIFSSRQKFNFAFTLSSAVELFKFRSCFTLLLNK